MILKSLKGEIIKDEKQNRAKQGTVEAYPLFQTPGLVFDGRSRVQADPADPTYSVCTLLLPQVFLQHSMDIF